MNKFCGKNEEPKKIAENIDDCLMKFEGLSNAEVCKFCRSRQELSNECLLAKIGVDTAENELLKVHLIIKPWDFFSPSRPALELGFLG